MKFSASRTGDPVIYYTSSAGGRSEAITIERARVLRAELDRAIRAAVKRAGERAAKLAAQEAQYAREAQA